jgi:predicted lactoylglutathione lyase
MKKFGEDFKLGTYVQIILGVRELKETSRLYQLLGFKEIDAGSEPWPWILFTDGNNLIQLNIDGNIYTGLTYFDKDMEVKIAKLEEAGINFIKKSKVKDNVLGIFQAPDGFMVGLVNYIKRKEDYDLNNIDFKLGDTIELAYGVKDLKVSMAFWSNLGFTAYGTYENPYPWAILQDGLITLGLHQSQEIPERPILTYFAKNQASIINTIKKTKNVAFKAFDKNNIVVTTPDGHQINIFQW